ncbi:MAG: hypothetical protein K8W52_03740 [Deltaproteobacteria bacterium]|nr:hypothetical protein [Deltaproteobacteria bacterium]
MRAAHWLMAGVATAAAACAPADEASGTAVHTVNSTGDRYDITFEPGHTMVYQLGRDGTLVIGERGDDDHDLPFGTAYPDAGLEPVKLWQATNGLAEVPTEIVELSAALARAHVALPASSEDAEVAPAGDAGDTTSDLPGALRHGTSSAAHFRDAHAGCFSGPSDVFKSCRTNWSNGYYAFATSRWAVYKMAPYAGNSMTVQISIGGAVKLVDTIATGGFYYYWAAGAMHDHDKPGCSWWEACSTVTYPDTVAHRLDLLDASGDAFHVSARMHNIRTQASSCAMVLADDDGSFPVWCGT